MPSVKGRIESKQESLTKQDPPKTYIKFRIDGKTINVFDEKLFPMVVLNGYVECEYDERPNPQSPNAPYKNATSIVAFEPPVHEVQAETPKEFRTPQQIMRTSAIEAAIQLHATDTESKGLTIDTLLETAAIIEFWIEHGKKSY